MISRSVFSLEAIDKEIESAIAVAINNFHLKGGDIDSWANTDLKNTVENKIKSHLRSSISGNNCPSCPPQKIGFGITIGIQVLISYNIRFKGNLNIGYGNRYGDFATSASLHLSAYNSGLGVGVNKDNVIFDITAAVLLTAGYGGGSATPLQSYSLNYDSPIPFLNEFKRSLSYGQALTWNSALNKNKFSLDRIQREGLVGFRIGNVNVSSNNDTKRLYFGGGTDMGWTGGISIATPFMEIGFQDFTGDYRRVKDKNKITSNQYNDDDKKREALIKDNKKASDKYHRQTKYHKNLNKASTYLRFNNNGSQTTIDIIAAGWLQDIIHRGINDFRFEYEHKNLQLWHGKTW